MDIKILGKSNLGLENGVLNSRVVLIEEFCCILERVAKSK